MNHYRQNQNSDFTCRHCRRFVSSQPTLAGVNNRNHCPYCLWSRHLDLWQPGDRLSACKGVMRPMGVTFKATRKKYGPGRGELMVVHRCVDCEKVSINRIAADDDATIVLGLVDCPQAAHLAEIRLLSCADRDSVRRQLFGASVTL